MLLSERRCAGCHDVFVPEQPEGVFCNTCLEAIRKDNASWRCKCCGSPVETESERCVKCLHSPPLWDFFWAAGNYAGTLRDLILRAKFGRDFALLGALGKLAAHAMPFTLPHNFILTPIPLSQKRLRERGWNQSLEIAREIAKIHHIPIVPDLLVRIRDTASQKTLSARDRVQNMQHAFRASPKACGQHVLLVDDVITTGSTLRSASRALLGVKVASIAVVVLARD